MSAFQLEPPILGIDHGTKVIGLALSQTGYFAKPLSVIYRKSKAEDFKRLNAILQEHRIKTIVLGLPPVPPDFVGHSQADTVRNWTGSLAAAIPEQIPIYFWDEGLTSEDAEAMLRDTGKSVERVDAHAAALILQQCLDALREGHPAPERFKKLNHRDP